MLLLSRASALAGSSLRHAVNPADANVVTWVRKREGRERLSQKKFCSTSSKGFYVNAPKSVKSDQRFSQFDQEACSWTNSRTVAGMQQMYWEHTPPILPLNQCSQRGKKEKKFVELLASTWYFCQGSIWKAVLNYLRSDHKSTCSLDSPFAFHFASFPPLPCGYA